MHEEVGQQERLYWQKVLNEANWQCWVKVCAQKMAQKSLQKRELYHTEVDPYPWLNWIRNAGLELKLGSKEILHSNWLMTWCAGEKRAMSFALDESKVFKYSTALLRVVRYHGVNSSLSFTTKLYSECMGCVFCMINLDDKPTLLNPAIITLLAVGWGAIFSSCFNN